MRQLKNNFQFEVIIVDDNSYDATQLMIQEWYSTSHPFKTKYIRMDKNGGPAKARNRGILSASADLIAFTDSDCVADPNWISALSNKLVSDHNYAGVGGSVLPLDDNIFSRYYTFYKILEPPRELTYLVSANCIYWRDLLLKVNGFDNNIIKPGGEDVGLSLKLHKLGYSFGYEKNAIIYHDYRASLKDFAKTFYNYGFGCRLVTKNNFGI